MDAPSALVELDDRWLLPYRGLHVLQVRVSYQLTLLLDNGAEVEMETEVLLTHGPVTAPGAEPVRLAPERQEVAPTLALFGAEVLSAVVFKSGALRLVFNSGSHLNVRAASQVLGMGCSRTRQAPPRLPAGRWCGRLGLT